MRAWGHGEQGGLLGQSCGVLSFCRRLQGQRQPRRAAGLRIAWRPRLCPQHPAAARHEEPKPPRHGIWGLGWDMGGGQEELGEGRGMHINHYWRTSQLLSQAVACCCSWCSPDINHNSPTIDPFAAAIRKSVLVLSIF